jgi:hypothetical protein
LGVAEGAEFSFGSLATAWCSVPDEHSRLSLFPEIEGLAGFVGQKIRLLWGND